MALNLREKQRECIIRMLAIYGPAEGNMTDYFTKVLIYDKSTRDILRPLVDEEDLGAHGISLFVQIDEPRAVTPFGHAIYFVRPTPDNIERIISDASTPLYDKFHLNFSTWLPPALYNDIPSDLLWSQGLVFNDQYLDFLTLEYNLFTLAYENSYFEWHDPSNGALDIVVIIEKIVEGLYCVLKTLGVVPVIRCPPGGVAERVAARLDTKIREYLISGGWDFYASSEVPVLCLFDRDFDMGVEVQHDFRYMPLVHDLLGLTFNMVSIQDETGEMKEFHLGGDPFWVANGGLEFTELAIKIENQIKCVDDAKRFAEETTEMMLYQAALRRDPSLLQQMHDVIVPVRDLIQRAPMIDKHTKIATALLHEIMERSIDWYAKREYDMMISGSIDQNEVLSVLNGKGTMTDKLRFAIMYLICLENIPQREIEIVEAALREAVVDTSAFQYVKQTKSLNGSFASASSASRDNVVDWAENLNGQSVGAGTAGVTNLSSNDRQLALGRTVEALMEGRPNPEIETYMLFDPRSPESSSGSHIRGPFQEAIVFMIGGGNYVEHGNLQDLSQRQHPTKQIIYGTTEILTGSEFVEQLALLGKKMGLGSSNVPAPH